MAPATLRRIIAIALGPTILSGGCDRGAMLAPTAPAVPTVTPAGFSVVAANPPPSLSFAACLATAGAPGCFSAAVSAQLRVRAAAVAAPSAPRNLVASVSDATVTLSWLPPFAGDAVGGSYVVEAGSASGLANLASILTGGLDTTFQASNVGNGRYFVRVRAVNAGGISAPSNEVIVIVGAVACTAPPPPPSNLTANVIGNTVTLTWGPSAAATSYRVAAGSGYAWEGIDTYNADVGLTTLLTVDAARGAYRVGVRAANACGTSDTSSSIIVIVPAPTPCAANITAPAAGTRSYWSLFAACAFPGFSPVTLRVSIDVPWITFYSTHAGGTLLEIGISANTGAQRVGHIHADVGTGVAAVPVDWTVIQPGPFACTPDLPVPVVAYTGKQDYLDAYGQPYTQYRFDLLNKSAYADSLFAPAPSLPACGSNTNASRTWLDIYSNTGARIYGFCASGSAADLANIWFGLPRGQLPPAGVYITLTDRACNRIVASNIIAVRP